MNSELRMQLQIARTGHYGDIMRTTLFCLLGIAAIIGFGGGAAAKLPLVFATIAVTLFGALAGGTALDDISVLRDDMDDGTGASAYGQQAKGRNLKLLKLLSGALIGLTGLAEVLVLLL